MGLSTILDSQHSGDTPIYDEKKNDGSGSQFRQCQMLHTVDAILA